jgi:hypothetical protein
VRGNQLIGRIVGFEIPHQPAPVYIKPGREPRLKRTYWGRVTSYSPWYDHVFVESENAELRACLVGDLHTVMPVSY